MTRTRSRCIVLAAALLLAMPASAQQPTAPATPTALSPDSALPQRPDAWRPLRIAKWTAAAATAGTALYGFINNRRADDRFEELEQVCVDTPTRCANRLPSGGYEDFELEREYQEIRAIDGRARTALIASQVGMAASVVMFIIDLRNSGAPENIPYEPRSLEIGPAFDGGLSLRMRLRVGHPR